MSHRNSGVSVMVGPNHVASQRMNEISARRPQYLEPPCCMNKGFYWDDAILYGTYAHGKDEPIWVFWDGPVARIVAELDRTLSVRPRSRCCSSSTLRSALSIVCEACESFESGPQYPPVVSFFDEDGNQGFELFPLRPGHGFNNLGLGVLLFANDPYP